MTSPLFIHQSKTDYILDACDLLPWEVERVAVGDHLDDLAVDGDGGVAGGLDVGLEDAEGGVVLKEVGGLLDAAGVVDGHHVEGGVLAPVPAPQEVPPDPPEPVDRHLYLRLRRPLPVSTTAPSTNLHSFTNDTVRWLRALVLLSTLESKGGQAGWFGPSKCVRFQHF